MGQFKKLLKFRRLLTFLWFLVLPITFNWMSPVLIIMGGFAISINTGMLDNRKIWVKNIKNGKNPYKIKNSK